MKPNCPYCNAEIEINHDDGYGHSEDELHSQECGSCGKTFTYTTAIIFHYHTYEAPCLNGQPHDFKPNTTYPKAYTKMECGSCGESRYPTLEERLKFDIPAVEGIKQ